MFMLPVIVLVLLLGCSHVHADSEGKFNALRFGQSTGDYIQLSSNIMDASTAQFSVCTWLRKRYQASHPIVLHYSPSYYGFILGDDGLYNYVVGTNLFLQSEYSVPGGQWYHVCWTWSTATYTTTVYLDGEKIGSKATNKRELRTGGRMCLGNVAHETKYSSQIFGGDMFKMNIYSRVLSQSEIRSMASDICSSTEDRLTAIRILRWEEILLKQRAGSVTEISSGCYKQTQQLTPIEEKASETEGTLKDILRRLQSTEQELERSKEKLEEVTQSLTSTQVELDRTKQELAETKSNLTNSLTSTQVELDSTKKELADTKSNLTNFLTSTQDKLDNTVQELVSTKTNVERSEERLENVNVSLTNTLVRLNRTEEQLTETMTNLKYSEEKLESVTMSLNHTLKQLEAAKKDRAHSKWDVLYSDKFLNKKLTREMSLELKSTGNMLDLFVGMNITEKVIVYLKSHHEEDMVCLNTGN